MLITHVATRKDGKAEETLIRVTENLLDALFQLAKHGYSHAQLPGQNGPGQEEPSQDEDPRSEYLWIDAICINQDDFSKEEKQDQVAMMGDIYDCAQKVIIWLGKDDEHTEQAFEVMSRLAECDQDPANPINDPHSQLPSFSFDGAGAALALEDLCKFLGMGDEPLELFQWQDYCAFLRRGWFGRAWVLQERFFSRQTEVLCGAHSVDWDIIARCASVLLRTNMHIALQSMVLMVLDLEEKSRARLSDNRINNQAFFGVIHKDNAATLYLQDLLYYSRFVNATEPRDHVYALLGIWAVAQGRRGLKPSNMLAITPKYTEPLADIYMEATLLAIREAGNLNILNLVQTGFGSAVPNLPSWVPDYAQSVHMQTLLKWSHGDDTIQAKPWAASAGLTYTTPTLRAPPLKPAPKSATGLVVKGQFVDFIVKTGPTHGEIDWECKLVELLHLLPQGPASASPYASPQDAFWRTVIKDTLRKHQPAAEAEGRAGFPLFMAMRLTELEGCVADANMNEQSELETKLIALQDGTHAALNRLSSSCSKPVSNKSSQEVPAAASLFPSVAEMKKLQAALQAENDFEEGKDRPLCELMRDFELAFWVACSGRRVFVTAEGFFGVTSEAVKEGDEVWIVAGAATPFVLRQRNDAPSAGVNKIRDVVGEAYVHGIMYGEAARKDSAALREVILC